MNNEIIKFRPIEISDTDNIIKWRNNPRVFHNFIFDKILTKEMHYKWMQDKVKMVLVQQFIILEKKQPIGSFYFRDIDMITGSAEYGIFIGEDFAIGKGYGNYIAKKAIEYAFNSMGLSRVNLRVFEDNSAAIKSYENAGFIKTGRKEQVLKSGESRTVIFMKVEKEHYEQD